MGSPTKKLLSFLLVIFGSLFESAKRRSGSFVWNQEPTCFLLGTEITCEGAGLLTSEIVKDAGIYTKYTSAIIKGVTILGSGCFLGCKNLRNVTFIGNSVKEIQSGAFQDSGFYTPWNFTVPASCGYLPDPGMVWNCAKGLTWINVESGNANFTSYYGCLYSKDLKTLLACPPLLPELKFPSTVETISSSSMRWYLGLTISFPETVTTIGGSAMYSASVETLSLPASLTSIESNCLEGACNVTSITLAGGTAHELVLSPNTYLIKKWSGGVNYLIWVSPKISTVQLPKYVNQFRVTSIQGANKLTSVTFESGSPFSTVCNKQVVVDSTGTKAVAAVGGVTNVTIPSTVKQIEAGCFRDCALLEYVTLHSGITKIGDSAFRLTDRLKYINMCGASVDLLGVHSFCRAGKIETFSGAENVKNIGSEAFIFSRIVRIEIPSVKNISGEAFKECQELQYVKLRDIEYISTGAFYGCPLLKDIDLSGCSHLISIGATAIAACDIGPTYVLPSSVSDMLPSCFAYNVRLIAITFNGNSQYYKSVDGAIYSATLSEFIICPSGIENITTLPSTRTIVTKAFYGCANLYSVTLNHEIDTIEPGAFYDCGKIELVTLPRGIQTLGSRAFSSCEKLRFVLYCNSHECNDIQGDPFPTKPLIYVIYDYQDPGFGGHSVVKILDHDCNIPTQYFTDDWKFEENTHLWGRLVTVTLFLSLTDSLF